MITKKFFPPLKIAAGGILFAFLISVTQVGYAKMIVPFKGRIDFDRHTMVMKVGPKPATSPFTVEFTQRENGSYHFALNVEHWDTSVFELSTIVEGVLVPIKGPKKGMEFLQGEIRSRYTLINRKPVDDLAGKFMIYGGKLLIDPISMGNTTLRGFVQLSDPYRMDLTLSLSSLDLEDFLGFFVNTNNLVAEGTVSGDIKISGEPGRLNIQTRLASYNGRLGDSGYNNVNLSMEGIYPILHITDSNVTGEDGFTFKVTGQIDLSRHQDLVKQILSLNKEPIVSIKGQNLEWTLKRLKSRQGASSSTELKYLFRKNQNAGETGADGMAPDLLGVEQKVEF